MPLTWHAGRLGTGSPGVSAWLLSREIRAKSK